MTDAKTHRCPNCGGFLTFSPNDQKFHCPYCLSIFTEAEITSFAKANPEIVEDADVADTVKIDSTQQVDLYRCSSCGAEIYTDATTAATFCYYCHNPVVLVDRLSGEFAPEKLIPFQMDQKEARAAFTNWIKRKHYVDKNFYNQEQIEKLSGVYFPFWYVQSEGDSDFSANARQIRIWRVGDVEYTETKEYAVHRKNYLKFYHLLKSGLTKNMQQKMFENVEPFDFKALVDFKTPYLAGFQAEKRDIEYNTISEKVKAELAGYGQDLIQAQVNADYQSISNGQLDFNDQISPSYLLLPLWVLTYHHNKKVFYFAINGQTGKISGILPVNYFKLVCHTLLLFSLILAIGLIVGYLI
ncbi:MULTISPECIES: TFIIB-type zinc ribbon-containing protein [unclassified Enterococcus]|uniref:TFIIB-type zinc ribbon-containing protein n=1 Tax=unclassified Enterococcus TaxID=2608891 RepID=UPI001551CBCE|nr:MULTISPECIES: TFIIB-type zinc ribbon-containing protein [unclassified Enterococcus]MBS7576604.1 TFIIB-type zinc ribbon-containing protein [Enterococcus sp. MMGLQ5-2]MBS7583909.1 TFIIB-type zinc ribbon-containing protein [Enterococcus sp. MMGLQ5-1]NPD11770.1 TFIIB-type zinc ribbon-containing protein [Enterococcus sp. MMGLQ5-1]NPD36441.1 TFIIB-type zinc ribbon-containing protein [Enterococcus sp. MMGLQ5-2]